MVPSGAGLGAGLGAGTGAGTAGLFMFMEFSCYFFGCVGDFTRLVFVSEHFLGCSLAAGRGADLLVAAERGLVLALDDVGGRGHAGTGLDVASRTRRWGFREELGDVVVGELVDFGDDLRHRRIVQLAVELADDTLPLFADEG